MLFPLINFVYVIVMLSPMFIVMMVLAISIFAYQNLKGVFYLMFLILVCAIREFAFVQFLYPQILTDEQREKFKKQTSSNVSSIAEALMKASGASADAKGMVCNTAKFSSADNSSFSTFIMSFTFFYLFCPMYMAKDYNMVAIIFILFFMLLDAGIRFSASCYTSTNDIMCVLADFAGGGAAAMGICAFIYVVIKQPSILFYNELSDNVSCAMPSNQKFKCSLTQGDKIVATTTTP